MRHGRVLVPACELLVHAGDLTRHGTREEVLAFLGWFAAQPAAARVLVAGNHDRYCETHPDELRALAAAHDVIYLCDEGVEVAGLKVWGSPATPAFRSMAFNRARGSEIRSHWARIPAGLDLLVTHGPPRGLGDRMVLGAHVGCDELLARVREVAPRAHVFGHIHEAAGRYRLADSPTEFLNVATSPFLPLRSRPATELFL